MLPPFDFLISMVLAGAAGVKDSSATLTIDNLQEAFNGESNAQHRYLAFATQADVEGSAGIASLFRAAAKAEEFHARNHAEVIRKLGAEPRLKLEKPDVRSTRENLQVAMEGEIYERDKMYPPFIEEAKANHHPEAVRTFTYALKTEAEHARLFESALKNMEKMKQRTTYYVCNVCGYTVATLNFLRCLVCGHSKTDYIPVE